MISGKRVSRHKCPPWCHRCPLLEGKGIMPGCIGCSHPGATLRDCTCEKPTRQQFEESVVDRVRKLELQFEELQSRFSEHLRGPVEISHAGQNKIVIMRKEDQ